MFSNFPDGWPGTGLLLLRAACGGVLITQAGAYFSEMHEPTFIILAVAFAMMIIGFLLLIGLLTRYVALAAAVIDVSSMFAWAPISSFGLLDTRMTSALSAVIALALVCLGPGALSIDSRLFGRREIIIPVSSSRT